MNKKGVSQIVTTILIILLVFAAIIIVWGVVDRLIRSGGEIAEKKGSCIGMSLDITNVVCSQGDDYINVTVARGGDSVDGDTLTVSVTGTSGNSNSTTVTLPSLGSVVAKIDVYGVGNTGDTTEISTGITLNDAEGTMCTGVTKTAACPA